MELVFPFKGYHKGISTERQPDLTSPDLDNVMPLDSLDSRLRGGQRPAFSKLFAQRIGGSANYPVVAITQVTIVD